MTTDEKVEFAKQLARNLRIKRSEWSRWANYFRQHGDLSKALKLAQHIERSQTVRRDPKEAAQRIAKVIQQHANRLQRLSANDIAEVFGYVGRWLECPDLQT